MAKVELLNHNTATPSYDAAVTQTPSPEPTDEVKRRASWNLSKETLVTASSAENDDVTQFTTVWPKTKIWKNLLVISAGFLLLFTAYNSLANIQSSLNSDAGLGLASLCSTYVGLVVSSLFVPTLFIHKCGLKWTIVISILLYTTYIVANFYATFGTMIPSALLLGMGAAPLWSAKCTYLTKIGAMYAQIVNETAEVIIVRFFGVFFTIFQIGQLAGNLISSFVLQMTDGFVISQDQLDICGADYCNEDFPYVNPSTLMTSSSNFTLNHTALHHSAKPPLSKVYLLCGIYVAFAVAGALVVAIFVDNVEECEVKRPKNPKGEIVRLLVSTFRLLKDPNLLFLIPLTIFMGIAAGFLAGDFTKSFVTCSLGIHMVGFVVMSHGVVDAVVSLSCSPIVKKFGRLPLYLLAAVSNAIMITVMLAWRPDPQRQYVYFVIAGCWGMSDAIWLTQVNAFFGILFPGKSEAAFANFRLWESIGYILAFAYSNSLCISVKLYILAICLAIGLSGYLVVEFKYRHIQETTTNDEERSAVKVKE